MHLLARGGVSTAVVVFLTYLAAAQGEVPQQKHVPLHRRNASACTLVDGTYYFNGSCASGSGGCYDCEYTSKDGSYGCYEAPNPADGTFCFAIDFQNL